MTKSEWLKLAEKAVTAADPAAKRDLLGVEKNLLTVGLEERVKNGLEALYDLFAKVAVARQPDRSASRQRRPLPRGLR